MKKNVKFPEFVEISKFTNDESIKATLTHFSEGKFPSGTFYKKPLLTINGTSITISNNWISCYLSLLPILKPKPVVTDKQVDNSIKFKDMNQLWKESYLYTYITNLCKEKNINDCSQQLLFMMIKINIQTGQIPEDDIKYENGRVIYIPGIEDLMKFIA